MNKCKPPYFTKPGYSANAEVAPEGTAEVDLFQPDVYSFAEYLCGVIGAKHLIDFGCGKAHKLVQVAKDPIHTIGIDLPNTVVWCKSKWPSKEWRTINFEDPGELLDEKILQQSVGICADVLEHLKHPEKFLKWMLATLNHLPMVLFSTPDRDVVHGVEHVGPPINPHHVREWNAGEFSMLLEHYGFNIRYIGLTRTLPVEWNPRIFQTIIVVATA